MNGCVWPHHGPSKLTALTPVVRRPVGRRRGRSTRVAGTRHVSRHNAAARRGELPSAAADEAAAASAEVVIIPPTRLGIRGEAEEEKARELTPATFAGKRSVTKKCEKEVSAVTLSNSPAVTTIPPSVDAAATAGERMVSVVAPDLIAASGAGPVDAPHTATRKSHSRMWLSQPQKRPPPPPPPARWHEEALVATGSGECIVVGSDIGVAMIHGMVFLVSPLAISSRLNAARVVTAWILTPTGGDADEEVVELDETTRTAVSRPA